jgi:hypothetical protein
MLLRAELLQAFSKKDKLDIGIIKIIIIIINESQGVSHVA